MALVRISLRVPCFEFREGGLEITDHFSQLDDAFLRNRCRRLHPCVDVEHGVGAVPDVEPVQPSAMDILGDSFEEEQRGPDADVERLRDVRLGCDSLHVSWAAD